MLTSAALAAQVRSNIMNDKAKDVIFKSLEDDRVTDGPPKWPGKRIPLDTPKGMVKSSLYRLHVMLDSD